jgi:hypothetical protein
MDWPAPSVRYPNDLLNDHTNSEEFYGDLDTIPAQTVASSLHYYGPATVFSVLLPQQSPRKSYSSKRKVAMVRTMEERMAKDRSLTWSSIARDLGVHSSQIGKWQQQIALHQIKLMRTPGTHHNQDGLICTVGPLR